jgi:uncharacterized protein YjbJ (UPF0337 family)
MGIGNKIKNKARRMNALGKVRTGRMTGNSRLHAEGRTDQAMAGVRHAAELVKAAARDAAKDVRRTLKKR